jgi:hypothetical protein
LTAGPRLLNAAIPSGLSATRSALIGLAGKLSGQPSPYSIGGGSGGMVKSGRLFSDAPTVMQFFAVAGEPTEPGATTPVPPISLPSLPAAKQITQSRWFATKSSTSLELAV